MQLREAAEALGCTTRPPTAGCGRACPGRKTGRGYEVLERDVLALAERRAAGTPPRHQVRVRDWPAEAGRLRRDRGR